MPTSDSALEDQASKQLSWQAEELISEFDRSKRDKSSFDIDAAIKAIPEVERSRVMTELACIDLEHAFAHGQPPNVSGFLSTYSESFANVKLRDEVAREHYRLLRLHDVPVERQSVAERYHVDGSSWIELPLGSSAKQFCPFPSAGSVFCGYPLIAELGEGALGRVYLARQPDLASRLVVLKVTRQLTTEASELAKLQHAGVIPVYSIHQHAGLFAICMPYLGAITLAHLLRDSRVFRKEKCQDAEQCKQLASTLVSSRLSMIASTVRVASTVEKRARSSSQGNISENEHNQEDSSQSLSAKEQLNQASAAITKQLYGASQVSETAFMSPELMNQMLGLDELAGSLCDKILSRPPLEAKVDLMRGIAQAVAHAHLRKLVHQDLKPENILIANDGHPVLLDFNLAQSNQSQANVAGGTIPYMSAQHLQSLQGVAKPSPTNDIFSLGVIFYQLLTGQLPYPGNDSNALFRYTQDRRSPPHDLRSLDSSIPPSLAAIVAKCLAYAPEDRYQSAVHLEEDLTLYSNFLPLRYAPDHSLAERTKKWARRHPLLTSNASLITIAAAIVIALGVAWSTSYRRSERLEASRHFRESLSTLPETLSMLQSPGVEPELLERGIDSGLSLLKRLEFAQQPSAQGYRLGKADLLEDGERREILDDLGTLFFSMANARLQLAASDAPAQETTIDQTRNWNRLAAQLSSKLKLPVRYQAGQIDHVLLGKQDASPIDVFADQSEASTFAKMLTAYQRGLTAQWVTLADQLVSESPTDPSRWFSLASAKLATGEIKSALSTMDVAARLQPECITATFWRGVFRLKSNDLAGACDDFSTCLLRHEDLLAARYNRALALKASGNNAAALEDLNWIVDHQQSSPRIFSLRSQLFVALGDLAKARADVQAAIAAEPQSPDDWVARGVLIIQANPKGALSDFQHALKLDSSNTAAHFNSAHVYSEVLGDLQAAITSLTALERLGQQNASVIASRGILFARNKQKQQAAADAKNAAQLQPSALEMLQIAGIYSLIAEDEKDLASSAMWLARSIAANNDMESLAAQDPDLVKLRASPRFAQILGK